MLEDNKEFHDYIESLTERKIYGEITLYLQKGLIESCRVSERVTKSEVKKLTENRKSKCKVLMPVRKGAANGNN